MSDIDRRRHTCTYDNCMAGDMEDDPKGEWYHESAMREVVEALATYGAHDHACLLSRCSAGRPTKDGGYENMFGDKWYPSGEGPPCTCGLSDVFTHYKDLLNE